MAEQQIVNGIDVDGLRATMQAIRDQPEAGAFRFRAKHRWAGAARCFTTIQDFHAAGQEDTTRPKPFVLEGDEPRVLLGDDMAPNATEALLHALSACVSTTFIYHASARGVNIEQLEIDIEGNLDLRGFLGLSDEVRNGYELISLTFNVKCDASEEQIRELAGLAQARSPVFDIVTHETPVTVRAHKIEALSGEPARASM